MLVDSHCHLDYPALAKDLEGVRRRAKEAGVLRMVNIGTTKKGFAEVIATAGACEEVFCTFGVHPHHVEETDEFLEQDEIVSFANRPKVVGIGETGLDFYYDHAARPKQEESFRRHIRAAQILDFPLVVHSREAEIQTARILREEGQGGQGRSVLRGVLHCFSSKRVLAEEALELGFYISLSGILTFKKSEELREIARDVPLNRLLVETDAPFLAPEPLRGKVCEPSYVVNTAKVLASLKGVDEAEIARRTTENFFTLFSKVTRP